MRRLLYLLLSACLLPSGHLFSQLIPGQQTTPLPYFESNTDCYIVLRDGSRLEGNISIKNYEKEGGISLTERSGTKFKVDVRSATSWGLTMTTPQCVSPLSWFEWSNQKRRDNKEAERGFVTLTNGEVKDGKIQIEGTSSDEDMPGASGFFALEKLTFVDKSGAKTVYKKEQIKEYGRILPWALAPSTAYTFLVGEVMGKRRTKFQPGFVITNDGKKMEGNMQLIVKNTMNADPDKRKTVSDLVDEIRFQRSGKDEKIDMDDVFAYGITGLTINMLTNNLDKSYSAEEMNFHPGSVTTKDGKKLEGYVAYFPDPGNYYGVYVASKFDEPVTILNMKEIDKVVQDIALIEAFDPGGAVASGVKTGGTTNSAINGYVVGLDGIKYEGTVTLTGDKGFWCAGVDFTDKDNQASKFGGANKQIAYCVIGDNLYVQHESVFMKAEKMGAPLAIYNNPYPDNESQLSKALLSISETPAFQNLVSSVSMDMALRSGMNLSDAYNTGKGSGKRAAEILKSKLANKKGGDPYRAKKGTDYFIIDTRTGEKAKANDDNWELLLQGCKSYHSMDKQQQKQLLNSGDEKILEYINAAYGKK